MFQEQLHGIGIFIGVIWAIYIISRFIPRLNDCGVVPRTLRGLAGIPAMPFLHKNLRHILSNTIPLFILLALLSGSTALSSGSRTRPWEIVVEVVLLGGFLLWLVGRPTIHIGASGLVFGLIAFLIVSGFLERQVVSIAVAVLVGFIYGGTLILGVVPRVNSHMSWEGHLCSAVAGGIVAYALAA
jgi:membrane associated rhomboid family serine protease